MCQDDIAHTKLYFLIRQRSSLFVVCRRRTLIEDKADAEKNYQLLSELISGTLLTH